jgi:predicted lipid-binding transport protein (Tim44 family)
MKKLVFGFALALLGAALMLPDADARRLGGGRSIGAQRSITSAPPAQAPARPAQQTQQMAPAQQPAAAPAGTAAAGQPAAATGLSRWMPMLGGLALGGLLGWLLGPSGLGVLLLVALLGVAALLAFRLMGQRRGEAPQPMQYAGLGSETVAAPPPSQAAGFEAQRAAAAPAAAASVPAGFDVSGFLRGAKLNFMKLQLANDRGELEELREFTSAELFEELKRDVLGRGGAKQQTDVMSLNADLLEVITEGDRHWASVRFSGMIREAPGAAPTGFEEVWNLSKPLDGSTGWLLHGIQQMH